MSKEEFLSQYQTKEWYETSKRIKARDHNTCQMCGCNNKPLSVHHLYYPDDGNILNVEDYSLITLCEDCHNIQKESKDWLKNAIEDLRVFYTDYEILCAIKTLGEYNGLPKAQLCEKEYLPPDDCPTGFLNNLCIWRRRLFKEYETKE